jgi:alpha-galactosidase/6-phospho-beta-glucosidase family protein
MTPRIAIIGGGSAHWTPRLLLDFVNTPSLAESQVVLMDTAPESLPRVQQLADHIASLGSGDLRTTATTELEAALDGAQFVITGFSVGGFEAMRHDLEIPDRYGLPQPVGDSVGPGGISRALRSVPVTVGIARAMERSCPDALLVNVSNPLTALCRAVTRETTVSTVGLCNELVGLTWAMSLLFDVGMHEVDPVVGGVNHLPLVTALRIGGSDGFTMLRSLMDRPVAALDDPIWMEPPAGSHWRKVSTGEKWTKGDVVANNRLKLELFRRFGVLPGSSDTHVAEFFPWFVTEASGFGDEWCVHHYGIDGHRADKDTDEADLTALIASQELPRWGSGELVAPLLHAVVSGEERHLPVNIPNTGQVLGLDLGPVLECMGVANASGVTPRDRVEVGSVLGECLRRIVYSQELTVQAALAGDRTLVLEAMLTDQMAGRLPYEHIVALTDELLAATAPWLDQFAH